MPVLLHVQPDKLHEGDDQPDLQKLVGSEDFEKLTPKQKHLAIGKVYPDYAKATNGLTDDQKELAADKVTRKYAPNTASYVKGAVKQAGTMVANTLEGLGGPLTNPLDILPKHKPGVPTKAEVEEKLKPSNKKEELGGKVAEFGSYLIPTGAELEVPAQFEKVAVGPSLKYARTARNLYHSANAGIDMGLKTWINTGDPMSTALSIPLGMVAGPVAEEIAGPVGKALDWGRNSLGRWMTDYSRTLYKKVFQARGGSAEETAAKVLVPGTRNDAVGRGITALTSKGLYEKAARESAKSMQGLNEEYARLGDKSKIALKPIYDDFKDYLSKKAYKPDGTLLNEEYLKKGLETLNRMTKELGPQMGDLTPADLALVRREFNKDLYKENPYGRTYKVSLVNREDELVEAAASSMRRTLNSKAPTIGDINKNFHFWQTYEDIMYEGRAKAEQRPGEGARRAFSIFRSAAGHVVPGNLIGAIVGGGEGYRRGGVQGAEVGAAAGALVVGTGALAMKAAIESTGFRTISAVLMDRIARKLMTEPYDGIRMALRGAIDNTPRGPVKDQMLSLERDLAKDIEKNKRAETTKKASDTRAETLLKDKETLNDQRQVVNDLRQARSETKKGKIDLETETQRSDRLKKEEMALQNERRELIQKKVGGTLTPEEEARLAKLNEGLGPKTARPAPAAPRKKTALAAVPEGGGIVGRDEIPSSFAPNTPMGPHDSEVITPNQTTARVRNEIIELDELDNSFSSDKSSYPESWQPRPDRIDDRFRVDLRKGDMNYTAMGESGVAGDGAPIWARGPDGRRKAITRNAGSQALDELYEGKAPDPERAAEFRQRAEAYKNKLAQSAAKYGKTAEEVMAMRKPIHVRELLEQWDEKTIAKFAEQANRPSVGGKSAPEQAVELAKMMTPDLLKHFHPDPETGDFNHEFVNELFKGLPEEVVRTWRQADGTLSEDGERVVNRALFARAYPRTGVLETMAEKGDSQIKNVVKGMSKAAPSFIQNSRSILEKKMLPAADISEKVGLAAEEIEKLRKSRMTFENYMAQRGFVDQDPVVERILGIFGLHNNSFNRIGDVLIEYNRLAYEMGNTEQFNLLTGELEPPRRIEYLLDEAKEHVQRRIDEEAEQSVFRKTQREAAAGHSAESAGAGGPGAGEAATGGRAGEGAATPDAGDKSTVTPKAKKPKTKGKVLQGPETPVPKAAPSANSPQPHAPSEPLNKEDAGSYIASRPGQPPQRFPKPETEIRPTRANPINRKSEGGLSTELYFDSKSNEWVAVFKDDDAGKVITVSRAPIDGRAILDEQINKFHDPGGIQHRSR